MKQRDIRPIGLIVAGLLGCLAGGCGTAQGPERAAVEGEVTLDGNPIEQGSIAFHPAGKTQGMVAGGPITGGRYSISAAEGPAVGQNRVEIHASKKTGRKIPDPYGGPGQTMDETVEAVPQQYNTRSTLVRQVEPGKKNTLDFELTTRATP